MNDLLVCSYVFSCQEFLVLAALTGMKRVRLLAEEQIEEPDQKMVNLVLFQLYQKKLLTWKREETYAIQPEIRLVFGKMKAAEKEIHIYTRESRPLLCFWGEDVVVAETSDHDRAAMKVHALSKQAFWEELQERRITPAQEQTGYGPEQTASLLAEMQKRCRTLLWGDFWQQKRFPELLQREDWVKTIFLLRRGEGEAASEAVFILDGGLWDFMVYAGKDKMLAELFSAEGLRSALDR